MGVKPTLVKDGEFEYSVYYRDSSDASAVQDGKIRLILTSPPFFYSEDYSVLSRGKGKIPSIPEMTDEIYKKYLSGLEAVLKECARVLSKDGVLLLNIDFLRFETAKGNIRPLPLDLINVCAKLGLGCKDVWIYRKIGSKAFQPIKRLGNFHSFLLVLAKSNAFKWNPDCVGTAEGKHISSLWEFELPSKSGRQNLLFCPFPDGLVDRAIRLFTEEGDWVMDPFLGSGKVVARARALKRNAIGFEVNPSNKETIERAIKAAKPD